MVVVSVGVQALFGQFLVAKCSMNREHICLTMSTLRINLVCSAVHLWDKPGILHFCQSGRVDLPWYCPTQATDLQTLFARSSFKLLGTCCYFRPIDFQLQMSSFQFEAKATQYVRYVWCAAAIRCSSGLPWCITPTFHCSCAYAFLTRKLRAHQFRHTFQAYPHVRGACVSTSAILFVRR